MSELRTMEQRVTDIIKEIGVPAHLKGYYYVRDAILLVIENDDFLRGVTTKLYPLIAENHNTSASRVGRDIWHCIDAARRRGNTTFINHLFGPGKADKGIGRKEFITRIAELVRMGTDVDSL